MKFFVFLLSAGLTLPLAAAAQGSPNPHKSYVGLNAGASSGVVRSLSTPEVTVQLADNDQTPLTQASSANTVFGHQAGLGTTDLPIDNAKRTITAGRLQTRQPVSAVNTSLGLAFTFGHYVFRGAATRRAAPDFFSGLVLEKMQTDPGRWPGSVC